MILIHHMKKMFFYFKMALDEWIDKQEIIARQIDLDFE